MGLQVWLSLDGDLHNQGLSNITTTNNGATVDNNGKIGKCYSFDGNDDFISISCPDLYNTFLGGSQPFSIAFWVYHADTTRAILFGDYGLSGTIGFNVELTTGHQVRFYWNGTPDKTFNANSSVGINTWTHIVLVYDGNEICIYKNGVQQSDKYSGTLAAKSKTSGEFYLGRDNRTGATALNGKLNDFRIYDHALSPREIKEISKGLVLHYPLSMPGQENLYTGSRDFSGTWVSGANWTTDSEQYNGFVVKKKSSVWGGLAQNVSCSSGDIFTISFYAKVDSGGNILSIHRSSLGNVTTGLTILGGNFTSGTDWVTASQTATSWKKYWATVQITSTDITYLQWRIENSVANKFLYVCGMKLERGSRPTPWIPNSADSLYTSLGFNDGIEYDVSGYGHNGTKVGSITYDADTPRYNVCSALTHSTDRIQITRPPYSVGQYINQISISIWFKTDQSNGDGSNFFSLGQNNFIRARIPRNATSSIWTYLRYQSSPFATVKDVGKELTDNTWHHFVFVWDNGIQYFYLDGVLVATSDNSSTTTQLYYSLESTWMLGGYNATSEYFIGFLSDFRIYSTALSAEDVLELYHTPETLANNGTLLTQGEFVES